MVQKFLVIEEIKVVEILINLNDHSFAFSSLMPCKMRGILDVKNFEKLFLLIKVGIDEKVMNI